MKSKKLENIELEYIKNIEPHSEEPSNGDSSFELGWNKFRHYEDSKYLLYFNSFSIDVELYCDLFDFHDEIFYLSEALSNGKKYLLSFPEILFDIRFNPSQDGYDISLSVGSKHLAYFTAEPLFILEKFYDVMVMLLERAIAGNYIIREDAEVYLDSLKPFIEKLR